MRIGIGTRSLKRALAIVGLTGALFAAGQAQAVQFVGRWDPAFGSFFPELGWRGEATFFVPDACLALDGWVLNSNSCSGFDMAIVSAEVEFYKLSDPANPAFHETLHFDVPSPLVGSMKIEDGMLAGVLGTFGYTRASTLPLAGGPYSEFLLFFENDIARLAFTYDPPEGRTVYGVSDRQAPNGDRPFMTFSVVPEPGSLALLLTALGLLAALPGARRSRAR